MVDPVIEIISNVFRNHFGEPENAQAVEVTKLLPNHWHMQIVYPLAYMYAVEADGNPWYQHPVVKEMAIKMAEHIFEEFKEPGGLSLHRRCGGPLVKTYALLRDSLDNPQDWKNEIDRIIYEEYLPELRERSRLTVFSSANVGYGTNHLALELASLTSYIAEFQKENDWGTNDLSGEELIQFAKTFTKRFFNYQDEGGYWAESDGPAQVYNALTTNGLTQAAIDLDMIEAYRKKIETAAEYHTYNLLPNQMTTGTADGRNYSRLIHSRMAFCGFTAEGRALLEFLTNGILEGSRKPDSLYSGETLYALLQEREWHHLYAPKGDLIWEQNNYTYTIRDDFATIKRGEWISGICNFEFRPRPEGHWNLDYQNLFSLFHSKAGCIFKGSHGKNDPKSATFHKSFTTFDNSPIDPPMEKYIPGPGAMSLWDNGFDLMRDYRGFEGYLSLQYPDDSLAQLHVKANTRLSEYPVIFTLQPDIGFEGTIYGKDNQEFTITEKPITINGADLGGILRFTPRQGPHPSMEGQEVAITIPENAIIEWPHNPWNTYNTRTHDYTDKQEWRLLLNIPIGQDGVKLDISI